jgi:hypothetical protein
MSLLEIFLIAIGGGLVGGAFLILIITLLMRSM